MTSLANLTLLAAESTNRYHDGWPIYIETVRDEYVVDKTSTAASDGITVITPASGAGKFVRRNIPHPSWMAQLVWVVDVINGSDEKSGVNLANAIKTDAERQRRMGPDPLWNGGAYHIRYINDLPVTDPVRLCGRRDRNSCIYLHGSMTDGQGQTIAGGSAHDTLYSGTITALTTLDNSTAGATHSWELTSSGIPSSWTASSLVDMRIRLTSGASLGANSFAIKDLGTKKARCSEFMAKYTYTQPTVLALPAPKAPPTNGDTFVVERLTYIPNFETNMNSVDDAGVNTGYVGVMCESLSFGIPGNSTAYGGDIVLNDGGDDYIVFDSCRTMLLGGGTGGSFIFVSCGFYQFIFNGDWTIMNIYGGYADKFATGATNFNLYGGTYIFVTSNFIFQADASFAFQPVMRGFLQIEDWAVFDNATQSCFRVTGGHGINLVGKYWGTGNSGVALSFFPGTQASYNTNFRLNISCAIPEFNFQFAGAFRTTIPAFDRVNNVWTSERSTSYANLIASVATGGFSDSMWDPVTQSGWLKT
jgi:hypothetical protein